MQVSLGWRSVTRLAVVVLLMYNVRCRRVLSGYEWDYIVVGAGASGCAVSSGLAEDGSRVLVLEAGGPTTWAFGGRDQRDYFTQFGGNTEVTVLDVPGEVLNLPMNTSYFWDTVPWGAQGKGVGGSGVVNFGVAFIPSPEDFETWPEGWKYTDLEPFYREVLEATDVSTEASTDGELYLRTAGDIVNGVMKKHLGFTEASLNADPFNRVNVSTLPEQQVKNGQRHESCLAYLLPQLNTRDNIKLRMNAEVKRILFSSVGKASGVELEDGEVIKLGYGGKLVMASGPLNTPKLLMRSGIGSQSELERLDRNGMVFNPRELWVINEALGASLHDHSTGTIDFRMPEELRMGARLWNTAADPQGQADYMLNRTNFLTQFGNQRFGFLTLPGRSAPDFEIGLLSVPFSQTVAECESCFTMFIFGMFPRSRDRLMIQTPDLNCDCTPFTCKTGDFCRPNVYLSDERDKEETLWAFTTLVSALKKEGIEVVGMDGSDDGLREYIENDPLARQTIWHYAGSCTLGQCTDYDLKLVGTENMYVVDSSLFPTPIRSHNVITTISLARKAVQHVKRQLFT